MGGRGVLAVGRACPVRSEIEPPRRAIANAGTRRALAVAVALVAIRGGAEAIRTPESLGAGACACLSVARTVSSTGLPPWPFRARRWCWGRRRRRSGAVVTLEPLVACALARRGVARAVIVADFAVDRGARRRRRRRRGVAVIPAVALEAGAFFGERVARAVAAALGRWRPSRGANRRRRRHRLAAVVPFPVRVTVAYTFGGGFIPAYEAPAVVGAVLGAMVGVLAMQTLPSDRAIAPVLVYWELLGRFGHGRVGLARAAIQALEACGLFLALAADVGAASLPSQINEVFCLPPGWLRGEAARAPAPRSSQCRSGSPGNTCC